LQFCAVEKAGAAIRRKTPNRPLRERKNMVTDLVCGMEINENAAGYSLILGGGKYFFCSEGCRAEFKRRPQDYLKGASDIACCDALLEKEEEKPDV
jgi:YHS domain-containing protein